MLQKRNPPLFIAQTDFERFIENNTYLNKLIKNLPSRLMILTGISCVGKSSIAGSLLKKNNEIAHIEVDHIISNSVEIILGGLRDIFPGHIQFYFNLHPETRAQLNCHLLQEDAISSTFSSEEMNYHAFLKTIKDIIRKESNFSETLNLTISNLLHQAIRKMMLSGKTVILDMIINQELLPSFKIYAPCIVLMYSKPESLSQRIYTRNTNAVLNCKLTSFRSISQIHQQWGMFYKRKGLLDTNYSLMTLDFQKFRESVEQDSNLMHGLGCMSRVNPKKMAIQAAADMDLKWSESNQISLQIPADLALSLDECEETSLHYLLIKLLRQPRNYGQNFAKIESRTVIFDGMSMAGKTTIAKKFLNVFPNSKLIGRSEQQRKIIMSKLPSDITQNTTHGDKILSYARNHRFVSFRLAFPEINDIDQKLFTSVDQFCEAIAPEVFSLEESQTAATSVEAIKSGSFAVLDNLINKKDLSAFSKCRPTLVLVYCPFTQLIQHIQARMLIAKESNNPQKWRNPFNVYKSYTVFFGPLKIFQESQPLEKLFKADVICTLKNLCESFNIESYGIQSDLYINEIVELLGLANSEQVNIYPQLVKPDLVLSTKKDPLRNVYKMVKFFSRSPATNICKQQSAEDTDTQGFSDSCKH